MFFLGLAVGAIISLLVVSSYTRKRSGDLLARAYRLGYLEGQAKMSPREAVFTAIADGAYSDNVARATAAALEKIIVDGAMRGEQ
jgi:hypothetical protein